MDKTKILMTNGSFLKVESIEGEHSAILLTCIKRQIIGLENQFLVFLRVTVLDRFYCRSFYCRMDTFPSKNLFVLFLSRQEELSMKN